MNAKRLGNFPGRAWKMIPSNVVDLTTSSSCPESIISTASQENKLLSDSWLWLIYMTFIGQWADDGNNVMLILNLELEVLRKLHNYLLGFSNCHDKSILWLVTKVWSKLFHFQVRNKCLLLHATEI
jgi:hypothetical protein